MALGKNIKIDQLIPDNIVKKDTGRLQEEKPLTPPIDNFDISIKKNDETLKFIVEPSRRKSVKKAKIFIEGQLNISNAKNLTEKIKEVITQYNIIDFKLRNITDIDLSSIQILYYFTNLYNKGKKTIIFHIDGLPMNFKTLLVKTKYNKILFKKPTT